MKIVDQTVSAKAATKYVHKKRSEHSSCPTLNNCVMVVGYTESSEHSEREGLMGGDQDDQLL
ncbi:unnamed protein product [Dovyalis caffra]|uniref:Uncharacterized protein n=1 Tax=Dovyalis caffra TaxID=77055 RepID=A0AAV1SSI2_9ROSI|nr:unnamed protein product [Dovyalis caffra]